MRLADAKAVITGGASGLGLAVGRALVAAGARVAVLDVRHGGEQCVRDTLGKNAYYMQADITSEHDVERAVDAVWKHLGGITLAVNCAGVLYSQRVVGRNGPMSQADFARVLQVNLVGTFTVCGTVAHRMQNNPPAGSEERGVIINTASIAAYDGQIGQCAYAAAKGGVVSLTLPLAREFANFGVRVMAIAPGLFDTPMLAGLSDSVREKLSEEIPFPTRLGDPGEFAALVCHIYENPMLNGEVIRLDGGLRLPPT